MKDGKANIRYILMDMTHRSYAGTIEVFTKMHTNKQAGNILTVIPNSANIKSLVKVVGHVGWLEDEAGRLTDGLASGLMVSVYDYDSLGQVQIMLASSAWPQALMETSGGVI